MQQLPVKNSVRSRLQIYADLGITVVALVWGSSTVVSKVVLTTLPPFAFQAARFWLAFFTLGIIFFPQLRQADKNEWKLGILTGLAIITTYSLQTVGLLYTSVANAAFIGSLGVIIIPLLNAFLLKRLPPSTVIISVTSCVVGLYLLTGWQGGFNLGDFLCLLCALAYSIYTLLIDRKAKTVNPVAIATIQLLIGALVSTIIILFDHDFTLVQVQSSWMGILYTGIMATALVIPLQVAAQRYTTPTRVGIILLLEPVAAAILAFFFIHETLTPAGITGCLFILIGLVLAEWKHV